MSVRYDDVLTIPTPEGVDLELLLAGAASRFVSAIVDILVQIVLLTCVAVVLAEIYGASLGEGAGIAVLLWSLITFVTITGYDVFFEVLNSGRTPGKMLNGLRVVRVEGHPVTFVPSLIRNALRIVDFLPSWYLLGAIVILATPKNQRVGDAIAGTLVVRELHAKDTPEMHPQTLYFSAAPPTGLDATAVTGEELAAVRRFLERRWSLELSARQEVATLLAERLRPKLAGASELRGEMLLEAIAAAKGGRA